VVETQPFVVQAEQVQEGGVKVVDPLHRLGRSVAMFAKQGRVRAGSSEIRLHFFVVFGIAFCPSAMRKCWLRTKRDPFEMAGVAIT
jgi:hypothetical protein